MPHLCSPMFCPMRRDLRSGWTRRSQQPIARSDWSVIAEDTSQARTPDAHMPAERTNSSVRHLLECSRNFRVGNVGSSPPRNAALVYRGTAARHAAACRRAIKIVKANRTQGFCVRYGRAARGWRNRRSERTRIAVRGRLPLHFALAGKYLVPRVARIGPKQMTAADNILVLDGDNGPRLAQVYAISNGDALRRLPGSPLASRARHRHLHGAGRAGRRRMCWAAAAAAAGLLPNSTSRRKCCEIFGRRAQLVH